MNAAHYKTYVSVSSDDDRMAIIRKVLPVLNEKSLIRPHELSKKLPLITAMMDGILLTYTLCVVLSLPISQKA